MNVLDVNSINLRNAYPTAIGRTTGQTGTAANQTTAMNVEANNTNPNEHSEVVNAVTIGGQKSAVIGGIVFLGLLVGLMLIAKKVGSDGEFSSIKASAYNVLFISLAAVIGLPIWKFIFTKYPVPSVSTWVLSA